MNEKKEMLHVAKDVVISGTILGLLVGSWCVGVAVGRKIVGA